MAKRVIFVLAQKDFQDEEFIGVRDILVGRGAEFQVAAKTRRKALGEKGTEIEPNFSLAEIDPKHFDAAVFIDGRGIVQYLDDDDFLELARNFHKARKIVSAICLAPLILGNAGVLLSRTATGFPTQEQTLRNRGADYTGMPIEIDGHVITAKDTSAIKDFAEAIAYLLEI